jgi:nucleotide-binding universal stress UspA family protein
VARKNSEEHKFMLRTILVATDGSRHAQKALSLASSLAEKYGAQLILAHILLTDARPETLRKLANRRHLSVKQRDLLDNYDAGFRLEAAASKVIGFLTVPPPRELVEAISRQIMDRARKFVAKRGVKKIVPVMVEGDPAEAILDLAARHKASMIVMGSRGLSDVKGLLLGSTSHKVNAQAGCTCVSVK